ncbi:MAG: NADH-quinone oxidoreductase subunit L [Chloroflexi bacterium]|nr:NADH-quinone oxidoreductase subunit L [Chloroflexota bacterium]
MISRQTPWKHRLSALVSIAAILGAFGVFLVVFSDALANLLGTAAAHGAAAAVDDRSRHLLFDDEPWFQVGRYAFQATLVVDWLSVMMLGVVSFLSALIQVYSIGYMRGDNRFWWFFSVMSLFSAAMLGLVLAGNFLLLYVFWELVGLCSFLLIGFWYQERDNAEAAKKAFVTTRIGDVGLFIGLALLFLQTGTFQMNEIFDAIAAGRIEPWVVTTAGILVFLGAVGKSGQFPLHVWLPDAMAGPTPVSALIHSATMVAAGVYLVGRAFPLFAASDVAMGFIATIGTITAIFAATIALTQRDIKKILAYSTISQLGYMIMALGVGAYTAGLFHMFTHAFFKALLFLCAGSVIHSMEPVLHGTGKSPNDVFWMGGLRRRMPVTFWTFVIASVSLAGIFPLSGFWSKDAILAGALAEGAWVPFIVGVVTAFLTAFYMFRAIYLTFFGEERWRFAAAVPPHAGLLVVAPTAASVPAAAGAMDVQTRRPGEDVPAHLEPEVRPALEEHAVPGHHAEPHESPWVMALPLVIIAIPAAIAGWIGIPGLFDPFAEAIRFGPAHEEALSPVVASVSVLVALAGIGLATVMYWRPIIRPDAIADSVPGAYRTLYNKYYFDEAYQWLINRVVLALAALAATIDRKVINNGIVDTPAGLTGAAGERLRYLETGRVYQYAFAFIVGIVLIGLIIVLFP